MAIDNEALPTGYTARAMEPRDIKPVLRMIVQDDPDEADEAKHAFKETTQDHWVIEHNEQIVGMTGLLPADMANDVCWLSWTTLDDAHRGEALARGMLVMLAQLASEFEVRKLFVRLGTEDRPLTSSMPSGVDLGPYLDTGFVEEVRQEGFYTPNEDMITLGLHLMGGSGGGIASMAEGDARLARVQGIEEIEDTDGTFLLDWTFDEAAGSGMEEVEHLIGEAIGRGARLVVASAASDCEFAMNLFEAAGFYEAGRMLDYYEDGVDDVQYRLDTV